MFVVAQSTAPGLFEKGIVPIAYPGCLTIVTPYDWQTGRRYAVYVEDNDDATLWIRSCNNNLSVDGWRDWVRKG